MDRILLSCRNVLGVTQDCLLVENSPVTFDLRPGEIGIIKSGFKASSFIRLAALRGIITHGSLEIMDTEIHAADKPHHYLSHKFTKKFKSSIGFCHKSGGLLANMTILDNVMLPAHYHSNYRDPAPFYKIARERLREISVPEDYWELRPSDVPQEFRKRVLFARSIMTDPEILIIDEPVEHVPWKHYNELAGWLISQKNQGRGILMATSNDPFACLVGSWLVDIDSGECSSCEEELEQSLGELAVKSCSLLKEQ